MAFLEVMRTADGRVLARRADGLPLTAQDREEAKRLAGDAPRECSECGQPMTVMGGTQRLKVWVCWHCAKSV